MSRFLVQYFTPSSGSSFYWQHYCVEFYTNSCYSIMLQNYRRGWDTSIPLWKIVSTTKKLTPRTDNNHFYQKKQKTRCLFSNIEEMYIIYISF